MTKDFSAQVNRAEFLGALEPMEAGLARKVIIEQSGCYVFKEDLVVTYNDEIACRAKNPLPGFEGAVQGRMLLTVLRRYMEETIGLRVENGHLVVSGKNKETGVRMQNKISLPVDKLEKPKEWVKLDPKFCDGVSLVQECAGTVAGTWVVYVHITPNWVEACDNRQMSRFRVETGVTEPVCVKRDSLKAVPNLGMTKIYVGEKWVHFKNPAGLVYSCRRWIVEYKDLGPMLGVKGEPAEFPKQLIDAAKKASDFSGEDKDNDKVTVSMFSSPQPHLKIKGEGQSGYHKEVKRLSYSGPPVKFRISPNLLIEFVKKHTACEVNPKKLRVKSGRFVYVACLAPADKKEEKNGE